MKAEHQVVVRQPVGATDYLVARVDSRWLRVARVRDLTDAEMLGFDWDRGDFSTNPGRMTPLQPRINAS